MKSTVCLIRRYYDSFNARDMQTFFGLLTNDVVHDISQGGREIGRGAFERFMTYMNACYDEHISDLEILTNAEGTRAATEFTVRGTYVTTDPGLPASVPPAAGQAYVLPAGAFFEVRNGQISRISNHYNLRDWIRQVGGG